MKQCFFYLFMIAFFTSFYNEVGDALTDIGPRRKESFIQFHKASTSQSSLVPFRHFPGCIFLDLSDKSIILLNQKNTNINKVQKHLIIKLQQTQNLSVIKQLFINKNIKLLKPKTSNNIILLWCNICCHVWKMTKL